MHIVRFLLNQKMLKHSSGQISLIFSCSQEPSYLAVFTKALTETKTLQSIIALAAGARRVNGR
uniref:Uncharacterized protein n=1 Tax=Rheinheimera sp. BAL341 TaxID=1708203 RepID=A0A486XM27_9GAMM